MILAFDTYYFGNKAKTVALAFEHWDDERPVAIDEETLSPVAPYEPGAFYKRELPCILSLLKKISNGNLEAIVVDGYVILDDDAKLGLGGYLYEALDEKVPVIGVAKSSFHSNKKNVVEVLRGESKQPLYVTAKGMDLAQAGLKVKKMHGDFRMPTLLKLLDAKTRELPKEL